MNNRDSAEDFLLFLSELSLTDIIVAKEIYEQQKNMVPYYQPTDNEFNELETVKRAGWENLQNMCNLNDVEFRISLIKLARSGLIAEIMGVLLGYRGGVYTITPAFKKLMKLIAYANEPLFEHRLK
ncbi:MAG: hypothetical protein GEU26_12980 [Nitrososphaeraceae archaeon]|nr:hypothetical protein [Nitrososphaeraceae archaeon]